MALQRPLARPPIREAIVEVKSEPVEMRRVTDLRDRLAAAFPVSKPFRMASVAMNLPDERRGAGSDPTDARQTGWRCESADGVEVALIRQDGLSYGRLAAYPGWERFADRFDSLWSEYLAAARPPEVRRIALRYVNDLRLPVGERFHFERFLTTAPRTPVGMPPEIADWLVQMTLPGGADGLQVAVTQATDSSGRTPSELPVIVDIDASWERTIGVDDRLAARLAESLGMLRDLKNRVFFGLVTEELMGAYS